MARDDSLHATTYALALIRNLAAPSAKAPHEPLGRVYQLAHEALMKVSRLENGGEKKKKE